MDSLEKQHFPKFKKKKKSSSFCRETSRKEESVLSVKKGHDIESPFHWREEESVEAHPLWVQLQYKTDRFIY